ncbi:TrmH family RNA methyltransferase [Lyngbya confervoides]|uniref:RNA methyltransferase n=1 Tax=Lyngbya confervoides BDU141951 TaxID=1574623 RepID=A0ABD4SXL3_9CYAN|nr:RNA methyltransferase [Lyngbya confervoides]MCM1981336.1 RNA methyltransferase [Lyngbya confervoides BDU141951]
MLTSRQNPLVKTYRKLHQVKYRRQMQACLIEGTHLMEAAIQHSAEIICCCMTESWQARHAPLVHQILERSRRTERVSPEVLAAMTTTHTPDGIAAIVAKPDWPVARPPILHLGLGLVSIQDPGNLGTLLRSACAVAVDCLLLSADCVDLSHPKVMRASAGAWFQAPIHQPQNFEQALRAYQADGVQIIATSAQANQAYWSLDLRRPSLILIGNEGAGLSPVLQTMADQQVHIPVAAGTESLNAAVAAALVLYEAQRQRHYPAAASTPPVPVP